MIGSSVSWGLYFFFYERAKLRHLYARDYNPLTPLYHLVSAMEAGTICVFLTNPIWLVKTRLQLQMVEKGISIEGANVKYRGVVHTIRTIVAEEGILGLVS